MLSAHRYLPTIVANGVERPISGALRTGQIVVDATRAPHVSATLTIGIRRPTTHDDFYPLDNRYPLDDHFPSLTLIPVSEIDPRVPTRLLIRVDADFPGYSQARIFDLGLRRRPVSHREGTVTLSAASDELLLEDFTPLYDDTVPMGMTTVRQIAEYVIDRAIPGAVLSPGPDAPATRDDADPDALLWQAGRSAMDFLLPILQAVGLRPVCDETRTWTLRSETWTGFGDLKSVAYGVNMFDGGDVIDRDGDEWFDAQVTRYRWTNSEGQRWEAADSFALSDSPTRTRTLEVDAPFPGYGRSEYSVRRAQQRGRSINAVTVSDWSLRAEQPVAFTVQDTPIQVGAIDTLTFDLGTDEVSIDARTIDTPDTAWIFIPPGKSWADIPAGTSWEELPPGSTWS